MDVLITSVGRQDPYSWLKGQQSIRTTGSVLTLVEYLRSTRVYLLPTQLPADAPLMPDGSESYTEAELTREELLAGEYKLDDDAVTIIPLAVESPADYTQAQQALHMAARRIMDELKDAGLLTLHVSAASGTPAIKTGMILLVSSGALSLPGAEPPLVYQVADPKYKSQDRVTIVDVTIIEAARLVDHVCGLLEHEELDAARQDLQRLAEIASSPSRRALAATLDRYVAAHQLHQQLAYGRARQTLSSLQGDATQREQMHGIADLIRRQIATLQCLIDGEPKELFHDLLLNAEQRQRRGEYADALARCWRVIEGVLRERLRSEHTVDLDDDKRELSLTQASQVQQSDLSDEVLDQPRRLRRTLYVSQLMSILAAFGDSSLNRSVIETLKSEVRKQVNTRLAEQLKSRDQRLSKELRSKLGLFALRNTAELARPDRYRINTYDDLARWLNVVRNCSVMAHGHADVGDVDGAAAVALARQLVTAVMGAPARDHPFGLVAHEQTVRWAREALTRA